MPFHAWSVIQVTCMPAAGFAGRDCRQEPSPALREQVRVDSTLCLRPPRLELITSAQMGHRRARSWIWARPAVTHQSVGKIFIRRLQRTAEVLELSADP